MSSRETLPCETRSLEATDVTGAAPADDPGDDEQDEHETEQHERARPGALDLARSAGSG